MPEQLNLKLRDGKYMILHTEESIQKPRRQKRLVFGNESFSSEMVFAMLDYTRASISAYLHKFTLLRILDCYKEDVNHYHFLVNPVEHPQLFTEVA